MADATLLQRFTRLVLGAPEPAPTAPQRLALGDVQRVYPDGAMLLAERGVGGYSGVTLFAGWSELEPKGQLSAENWHRGFGNGGYRWSLGGLSKPQALAREDDALSTVINRGVLDPISNSTFAVEPGSDSDEAKRIAAFVGDVLLRRMRVRGAGTGFTGFALRAALLMFEGLQVWEVALPYDPTYRLTDDEGRTIIEGAHVLSLGEIMVASVQRFEPSPEGGWDVRQLVQGGEPASDGSGPRERVYPSRDILHRRHRPMADDPNPYGEIRPLYSALKLSDLVDRMEATAVQKGAMGVPLARYEGGGLPPSNESAKVAQILRNYRSGPHSNLMVPRHWSVEFVRLEVLLAEMIELRSKTTERISRALGCRDLHTGEDSGTQALHESVAPQREAMLAAVVADICRDLNGDPDGARESIIARLVRANFGDVALSEMPRLVHRGFRQPDPGKILAAYAQAVGAGVLTWTPKDEEAMREHLPLLPTMAEARASMQDDDGVDDDDEDPDPEPPEDPEGPEDPPNDDEDDDDDDEEDIRAAESYKIPESVQNNAKRAIRYREEYPEARDAGTAEGWTTARRLAQGGSIGEALYRKIGRFLTRHEGNKTVAPEYKDEPWRDNGWLMWLAWGGDSAKSWTEPLRAAEGGEPYAIPFGWHLAEIPPGIERELAAALRGYVADVRAEMLRTLDAALATTDDAFQVAALLRSTAERVGVPPEEALAPIARRAADLASERTRRAMPGSNNALRRDAVEFGPVDDLVAAFVRSMQEAVQRIGRNVFAYVAERLEREASTTSEPVTPARMRAIARAQRKGSAGSQLRANADFEAVDKLGTLVGAVSRRRIEEAGAEVYEWRSQRDARVRDDHADLDGQRFRVDGPGSIEHGHPGDAPGCRCYAVPVVD